MVPPDRKNAKTTQQVEVFCAFTVEQILALTALKTNVIADGLQDSHELFIEIAHMHRTALRLSINKHLGNV